MKRPGRPERSPRRPPAFGLRRCLPRHWRPAVRGRRCEACRLADYPLTHGASGYRKRGDNDRGCIECSCSIPGLAAIWGREVMTVAARQIDWDAWSQSRFLAWAETQPEGRRYEFDGFRPVARAPVTVGHNRIGRNIRDSIRPRLPVGAPCDTYGPQDAIETVGGALREPDAFIACSRAHRTAVAVPAPIVVFEVVSPGQGNRRRDEEKVDEYESVPSILR